MHIPAPSAVACDILHLRASAHPRGAFCVIGDEVSYDTKIRHKFLCLSLFSVFISNFS